MASAVMTVSGADTISWTLAYPKVLKALPLLQRVPGRRGRVLTTTDGLPSSYTFNLVSCWGEKKTPRPHSGTSAPPEGAHLHSPVQF